MRRMICLAFALACSQSADPLIEKEAGGRDSSSDSAIQDGGAIEAGTDVPEKEATPDMLPDLLPDAIGSCSMADGGECLHALVCCESDGGLTTCRQGCIDGKCVVTPIKYADAGC